jgi:hypothetical protein
MRGRGEGGEEELGRAARVAGPRACVRAGELAGERASGPCALLGRAREGEEKRPELRFCFSFSKM